ncbi:MAG: hypothetical protein ACJAR0_003699 [Candidatus Azotimanducaceae bacterium]|jgi:hypothetical protein
MDQIGLKDIPLQGKADDALGLGEYGDKELDYDARKQAGGSNSLP